LRMICSAVCLVRFMLRSPAQSGRLRTLIHPGLISGVHVRITTEEVKPRASLLPDVICIPSLPGPRQVMRESQTPDRQFLV